MRRAIYIAQGGNGHGEVTVGIKKNRNLPRKLNDGEVIRRKVDKLMKKTVLGMKIDEIPISILILSLSMDELNEHI
ncbi:hypothetical protein ACR2XG_28695 [Klebsiella pneumoniae]